MTDELSVIELILGASLTVKFVMATLVAASVTSWFMIVQRVIILQRANEELLDFEDRFWSGMDLAQLYRQGSDAIEDGIDITGGEALFRAGFKEFSKLSRQPNMDAEAMVEGSRRAMRVALMRESDRLERHLPFLASVGSTSPYIGLFGTVWGIMNSFQSIAESKNTSLAVVAPGIAEALFATALGLAAAIPAVIAYNKFAGDLDRVGGRLETFAQEFSTLLARQLDEGGR